MDSQYHIYMKVQYTHTCTHIHTHTRDKVYMYIWALNEKFTKDQKGCRIDDKGFFPLCWWWALISFWVWPPYKPFVRAGRSPAFELAVIVLYKKMRDIRGKWVWLLKHTTHWDRYFSPTLASNVFNVSTFVPLNYFIMKGNYQCLRNNRGI